MARSTRIWLLLVSALSVGAVAAMAMDVTSRLLGDLCLMGAAFAAVSILPSFVWCIVLARRKRGRDFAGVFSALLVALVCVTYVQRSIVI